MATRRQREGAAAPRPATNAGPRNHTAAATAPSAPRNQTAAAARSGPRNQTAATTAATCRRPLARNQRALGDIGNHVHVNAPVVDREANRRRLTGSLRARPNAATADDNAIAPGSCSSCSSASAGASRAVSGDNKKLSKGATTRVTRTREKRDTAADSLMERVAEAEAKAVRVAEEIERTASRIQVLSDKYVKLDGDYLRYKSEVTQTVDKLRAMVYKKESELQKVLDLNVRLSRAVDLKEAQLQAMREQCKALALNSN